MNRYHLMILVAVLGLSACSTIGASDRCLSVEQALSAIDDESSATRVSVCGFLKYEFEDKNLYLSQDAAESRPHRECLAIGLAKGFSQDLSQFNKQQVRVTGRAASDICPEGTLCLASCPNAGIYVESVHMIGGE